MRPRLNRCASALTRYFPARLAAAGIILASPPSIDPQPWATYVRQFDAYVQSHNIVGASTILIRDGRIVARHMTGQSDRARDRRVDSNTIFHYASITKTLTAVTVMELRDQGRLSLDDPVTRYIPELRQINDPYGSPDSITIRMLLDHSSGLQDPTWPWKKGLPWEPFEPTTWDQLVAMMPYQQLLFKPGTRWSYSNPAYIYLARIVESVTGESWLTYVQKNVFAPLGMTRSYFGLTAPYLAADRSHNYTSRRDSVGGLVQIIDNGPDFDPGITIPNGGWNAPLDDVAKWLAFLTGATGGDRTKERLYASVLQPASIREMQRPILPNDPVHQPADSMALGLFVHPRQGAVFVGHTGSQAGFTSFMFFNPVTRSAVVAAFNTSAGAHDDAFYQLCETAFDALR